MAFAPNTLSLVADIGGTNTRVALADGKDVLTDTIRRYPNVDFAGLESVINRYVGDMGGVDAKAACVAVAGPVRDGRADMTNLDWTIDKDTVARATRAETVAVLNDLQAQGHALGFIDTANLRQIAEFPEAGDHAAKLVVGVGTGFNAAPVFETAAGRYVTPSESGHVNLPVQTERELDLARYVGSFHGFPSVEDVISGRGLERVYAWLGHTTDDPRELRAAQIMDALADGSDPRAEEAAQMFVTMLGSVVGNLALTQLPFGGIYLVGGVSRAIAPYLTQFGFVDALREKGRFSGFMRNFGVAVIEDDYAALTGSAAHLVALDA